jgi:hypothetical protein
MKKIFLILIFILNFNLFAGDFIPLKDSLLNYDKNDTNVDFVYKNTYESLKWIQELNKQEQIAVLSIYRSVIEKLSQRILDRVKQSNSNFPVHKYLRIIGVGDLILLPHTNDFDFIKLIKDEVSVSIKYIDGRVSNEILFDILATSNAIKTSFLTNLKKGQFEEIKLRFNEEFEKSIPLIFDCIRKFELKIVNDASLNNFFMIY